jgi:dTMP kinase
MTESNRGAFICFEGIDGSGKSTQAALLAQFLRARGCECVLIGFPESQTHTGQLINDYLSQEKDVDDHAMHLLFSANRWERQPAIKTALSRGTTVICDRYSYSGVAYSMAKGLDEQWCRGSEIGMLQPDIVFFLYTTVGTAIERAIARDRSEHGMRFENAAMLDRVRSAYTDLIQHTRVTVPWHDIVNTGDAEAVHGRLQEAAVRAVEFAAMSPVKTIDW